jgi:hypothetical protein
MSLDKNLSKDDNHKTSGIRVFSNVLDTPEPERGHLDFFVRTVFDGMSGGGCGKAGSAGLRKRERKIGAGADQAAWEAPLRAVVAAEKQLNHYQS